jgi:hypothetical protein
MCTYCLAFFSFRATTAATLDPANEGILKYNFHFLYLTFLSSPCHAMHIQHTVNV